MRNSFVIHLDSLNVLDKLSDEQAGKLIKIIRQYRITGSLPEAIDLVLDVALQPFISQFERDDKSYEKTCQKNRDNIAKRWGNADKSGIPPDTKNTTGKSGIPPDTKNTDSDSDSDSDSDLKEKSKKEKTAYGGKPPKPPRAKKVVFEKSFFTNPDNLPYKSKEFLSAWEKLLATPKWRNKSPTSIETCVKAMRKYDEAFATQQIDRAIMGEWQGLFFPESDQEYQRFRKASIHPHVNAGKETIEAGGIIYTQPTMTAV